MNQSINPFKSHQSVCGSSHVTNHGISSHRLTLWRIATHSGVAEGRPAAHTKLLALAGSLRHRRRSDAICPETAQVEVVGQVRQALLHVILNQFGLRLGRLLGVARRFSGPYKARKETFLNKKQQQNRNEIKFQENLDLFFYRKNHITTMESNF